MKTYKFIAIASVLGLAFVTSCQKEMVKEADSIELDLKDKTTLTINVGQTATVTPSFTPDNADPDLVWKSSNDSIATVKGGYVYGVAPGEATITVTATGNVSSAFTVTVKEVFATALVLSKNDLIPFGDKDTLTLFEEGKNDTLVATIEPYNTTYQDIVWTSSDTTIVKVDSLGILKQVGLGKANITATLHGDRRVAKCPVNVIVEIKDHADTTDCWKSDKAWHKSLFGTLADDGYKSVKGYMTYNYAQGMVEWTENASGAPRTDTIVLPSTKAMLVLTQLDTNDFKGNWVLTSKRFSNITAVKPAGNPSGTDVLTFGAPLRRDTLTDFNGNTHINSIGITGLYQTAVADACVEIDYNGKTAKLGMFLDARDNAQQVETPFKGKEYVCFLPEMADNAFAGPTWNFIQPDLDSRKDYCWLWFTSNKELTTFSYNASSPEQKQTMNGDLANNTANVIIGITVAASSSNKVDASSVLGANVIGYNTGNYPVIYQGNPSNDGSKYTITRQ